jgi:hypothetical protein
VGTEEQWSLLLAALRRPAGLNDRSLPLRTAMSLGLTVTPSSVGCSVTEIIGESFSTPTASGDVAIALDRAQYQDGAGPCIAAARERVVHRLDVIDAHPEYRTFRTAADRFQVGSSLSMPLEETPRPAALNLYASESSAFDNARSLAIAGLLSRCVAALLRSPGDAAAGGGLPDERIAATQRHDTVIRAQTLLADRDRRTPHGAYTGLVRLSIREQRSIVSIARDVIASTDPDSEEAS